eukprot:jgi/Chrzof1/14366/Cz09g00060.t1
MSCSATITVTCGDCQVPNTEGLVCRFRSVEAPAYYDSELRAVCCDVPKALVTPNLSYEVVDGHGRVVCKSTGTCKPATGYDSTSDCKVCDQAQVIDPKQDGTGGDPPTPAAGVGAVLSKLSWLDRLLPVWIIIAMVVGVVLGYFVPAVKQALQVSNIAGVSLPIALGLWWMMFPVLTKVKYELLGLLLRQKAVAKQFTVSFILNWVVGPALMAGLAWACLPDLPHYRNGVILVGLARCIAMVLIWNELSLGHNELCAVIVAINSVLQIVLYSPLALFYIKVVSHGEDVNVGFWPVAKSVLLFLGVPLVAGILLRYILLLIKDQEWFEKKFMPWFGPTALLALLYTIIVMFASQGDKIIGEIGNVARVAVPMLIYFSLMFFSSLAISYYCHMNYSYAVTQAFTASSNNFELAIAVAVGTFGIESAEALAATVGPLIEVPVLLGLVYVALWIKKRFWDARDKHLKEVGKYPLDIHDIIAARAEADHNNAIALAAKDAQASSKHAQAS